MASLDELIAFNNEVASLTHAGVPIDLGLSQLNPDLDVANKQINAMLAVRVRSGVSLVDAIAEEDASFPAVYQGVVGAGLRCGHLPAVLEPLSRSTQALLDVRQSLRSALLCPLLICVLAYSLFVGSCWFAPSEYHHQLTDMGSGGGAVFHVLQMLRVSLPFWGAIPPVLLTALLFAAFRSNSARTMWVRGLPRVFSWLPGVSRITAAQRCASLAELLALLVENDVPFPAGLRLAARASGDSKLASAAQQMASAAEQGQALAQDADPAHQFPPLLRWALTSQTKTRPLAGTLRLAATTYRHRAERQTKRLRVVMPTLTFVVLAGGITLLYCLSIFVPLVRLVNDLS